VAFLGPGLLYHLGDRAGAAIIAHRMGHAPHTDILSTFVDVVVMGVAGVAAVFAYTLASLLAHRGAARSAEASAPRG
jgi:Zn-dependent protease with chaperone function